MRVERDPGAIDRLPEVYARALRLADQGHRPGVIAQLLGLEMSAVGPLLEVAELKLAEQVDEAVRSGPSAPTPA